MQVLIAFARIKCSCGRFLRPQRKDWKMNIEKEKIAIERLKEVIKKWQKSED